MPAMLAVVEASVGEKRCRAVGSAQREVWAVSRQAPPCM